MGRDKRPGASPAAVKEEEKKFPQTAWAQLGLHAHADNPGSAMGWHECRCDEGEALRPAWANCRGLGAPCLGGETFFHLHVPPKGSIYPDPPASYDIRRMLV
jgi:hypothetical protein